MSDPLRVALVAEGPTDRVVIESALRCMLGVQPFVLKQLQPEGSLVFGERGAGWTGVYSWCRQSATRGHGHLRNDALVFTNYDVLILHLDAEVAAECYSNGGISPQPQDGALPCERPCPPASATTELLRAVLMSWCGETAPPAKTVLCMPSKSTEAWVVAALYPYDLSMKPCIECFPNVEARLGQQPKRQRIRKKQRDYESRAAQFTDAWPRLTGQSGLGEARRFDQEFKATMP